MKIIISIGYLQTHIKENDCFVVVDNDLSFEANNLEEAKKIINDNGYKIHRVYGPRKDGSYQVDVINKRR